MGFHTLSKPGVISPYSPSPAKGLSVGERDFVLHANYGYLFKTGKITREDDHSL
jgi:hypothetical protein